LHHTFIWVDANGRPVSSFKPVKASKISSQKLKFSPKNFPPVMVTTTPFPPTFVSKVLLYLGRKLLCKPLFLLLGKDNSGYGM